MEWSNSKTKLSHQKSGREMKRIATEEHPAVVTIPEVVRVAVVAVEPRVVRIAFDVEHVEVAVRVSCCAKYLPYHHPLNTLGIESHSASKCHNTLHQVSSFFDPFDFAQGHPEFYRRMKFLHTPLYSKPVVANILDVWILDSAARMIRFHAHIFA